MDPIQSGSLCLQLDLDLGVGMDLGLGLSLRFGLGDCFGAPSIPVGLG